VPLADRAEARFCSAQLNRSSASSGAGGPEHPIPSFAVAVESHPFEYVVWFRDGRLPADDEDYEWPAVFIVTAESAEQARAWGDHLAQRAASRSAGEDTFLRSSVEPHVCSGAVRDATQHACPNYPTAQATPVVRVGAEATDEFIGW
jgi:hypothetical protein